MGVLGFVISVSEAQVSRALMMPESQIWHVYRVFGIILLFSYDPLGTIDAIFFLNSFSGGHKAGLTGSNLNT
jgi:hypothetical protein